MKKLILLLIFIAAFASAAFAQTSVNLILGNPSGATADESNTDDYLVVHSRFILSYNKSRGAANRVTWHLSQSDAGAVDRSEAFALDMTLPQSDWRIKPADYRNSDYDRGHLCPSKDRSDTEKNNQETFLISNLQPQSPKLNQKTWKGLEDYTRQIVGEGREAYVYAGCYGEKGTIKDKVTVPTRCRKIIVVLPGGTNNLKRIKQATRVIAVVMPNEETSILSGGLI